MKYENQMDRAKQAEIIPFLENKWECRVEETPEKLTLPYDFMLYGEKGLVAILELKCRSRTASFFEQHGWLMDVPRINKLRRIARQKKVPAILGCVTIDRHFLYIPVARAYDLKKKDKLPCADLKWMTDDHGTKQSSKEGVIIPYRYISTAGRF